jgi:hypothetical protein
LEYCWPILFPPLPDYCFQSAQVLLYFCLTSVCVSCWLNILFTLKNWQLLTTNSLSYKFWKDVFLTPCAPFRIFTFEFSNNCDVVFKCRIRALQSNGLANRMKLQNITKRAFIMCVRWESLQLPWNVISTQKM